MDLVPGDPIAGGESLDSRDHPVLLSLEPRELDRLCRQRCQVLGDEVAERRALLGGADARSPVHVVRDRYRNVSHGITIPQFHRPLRLSPSVLGWARLRDALPFLQQRCTPNGIRTRVTALKGRRPGPLDDGGPLATGRPKLLPSPDRWSWRDRPPPRWVGVPGSGSPERRPAPRPGGG